MPRDMIKTATYSLMHLVVAVSVVYALTGDWRVAIGIGLIEPAVQTIAYAAHEKMWQKVPLTPRAHAEVRYRVQASSQ